MKSTNRNRPILLIGAILLCQLVFAQVRIPVYEDTLFSAYYQQRLTHFQTLPSTKGEIIFLGNSITDGAEWSELFKDSRVKNRGISGDNSAGVLHRLGDLVKHKPAKIFLLIGINDLAKNTSPDSIVKNIWLMADYIQQQSPATRLYVQSLLPVNNNFEKFTSHTNKWVQVKQLNAQLEREAARHHYTYIDLYFFFTDWEGKLDKRYTNDGLHLKGEGYLLWKHLMYPYLFDLQQKPALLPMPQRIKWGPFFFPLFACRQILVKDKALNKEAALLQGELADNGLQLTVTDHTNPHDLSIVLEIDSSFRLPAQQEAYRLKVDTHKIRLIGASPHGVYNGLQTLRQLMRDYTMVDNCEIADWPAFSWRGYMVDVGRNYQSVDLLKQQINKMAQYKLNVFHFHATEDIAWRIAIKAYPQLTAPGSMLRNKGLYYSEEDIRDLIEYCRERYIQFVPELDMPGHSGAFRRAMQTDMQSDSGMTMVKNILREFCSSYDLPYIHIGGDEVKITNKKFLPEIISYVQSLGKKTIGWSPGGNIPDETIRQLWMADSLRSSPHSHIQYIDSRHLYINHYDPEESVVTLFFRKLGNKKWGDSSLLGATLCLWHDRALANEEDLLNMNPVYPSLLSFAERSWLGGGQDGWTASIGPPNSNNSRAFEEFENRLLDHKRQYFSTLPFPYMRQSNLVWNLYGPYPNGGDLSKKFAPEYIKLDSLNTMPSTQVVGGTIVLRHWWAPQIQGAIQRPLENSTWYASLPVWSAEEKTADCWIGFNNLSRSPATNSPQMGTWDNKNSEIWINGDLISPPHWRRPGQQGNSEIPLLDEGYEYRQPTKINLHKGWNTILIKAPVGGFKGPDWQNPVKWMFTFLALGD